jgi:hypothetical protein
MKSTEDDPESGYPIDVSDQNTSDKLDTMTTKIILSKSLFEVSNCGCLQMEHFYIIHEK